MGRSTDQAVLDRAAAGGVTTALCLYLLETGKVQGLIQCGMSEEKPWEVVGKVSKTREEVLENMGSHYSTVPINAMLKGMKVKGQDRYALVGCGCHIAGLRKLQEVSRKGDRIALAIGIFCGANNTPSNTLHLIEEMGIEDPSEIEVFKHRIPGGGGAEAILKSGEIRRVGSNFAHLLHSPSLYAMRALLCRALRHHRGRLSEGRERSLCQERQGG